ncbi:unnamed protein product, partial [Nesidiocoris tenuis]
PILDSPGPVTTVNKQIQAMYGHPHEPRIQRLQGAKLHGPPPVPRPPPGGRLPADGSPPRLARPPAGAPRHLRRPPHVWNARLADRQPRLAPARPVVGDARRRRLHSPHRLHSGPGLTHGSAAGAGAGRIRSRAARADEPDRLGRLKRPAEEFGQRSVPPPVARSQTVRPFLEQGLGRGQTPPGVQEPAANFPETGQIRSLVIREGFSGLGRN